MASYTKLFNDLYQSLPAFLGWMNQLLESNKDKSIPLTEFNFKKIKIIFSPVLLKRTKVVFVDGDVPLPPPNITGFQESSALEPRDAIGVTYKNTLFLKEDQGNEINCFHEMIHVVQWNQLGVERFIMAYGICNALYGYENNPFEQTARNYQQKLESNALPIKFLESVRQQTNDAWASVNPLNHLTEL